MAESTIRHGLTPRELATIRAALRLWLETPATTMPESVFFELGLDPPLWDGEIADLLTRLTNDVDVPG